MMADKFEIIQKSGSKSLIAIKNKPHKAELIRDARRMKEMGVVVSYRVVRGKR